MRFTVNREEFSKALNIVAVAIPAKAEKPVFQNVKISCTEKGIELLGSDNNITIRSIVPYMIEDREIIKNAVKGSTMITCSRMQSILSNCSSEFVDFELIDNALLKITYPGCTLKPNTGKAEEYPEIDLSLSKDSFDMKSTDLLKLVSSTAFAAATKETKMAPITAVNFEAHDGVLTATATDSARLARKSVEINSPISFNINIPAKKIADIAKTLGQVEFVTIYPSQLKAIFAFGNTLISTRLIGGNYPSTNSIFPHTFNYYLEINSAEFVNKMASVAPFGEVVKITMTQDGVELLARSQEAGSANAQLDTFEFSGERLAMSFNSRYVTEAIRAIGSEDVTICFVGEAKPFVVKNSKDESVDMLITPYRS